MHFSENYDLQLVKENHGEVSTSLISQMLENYDLEPLEREKTIWGKLLHQSLPVVTHLMLLHT